jgi:PST family polysaccharide transporter
MVGYGLGYSVSEWAWQLRVLVNPLVVGRYAGAEAVGYVALALRLVEQLSHVVLAASWRLSVAVFARLQGDRARLIRAVTEGMSLQVMAVGPLLAGFGLVAPWIIPLLFGSQWLPVLEVYPFIAISYLSMVVFILPSSTLHVLQRNWEVAVFNLVHVGFFAGAALLLVPQLGFGGYGWAEVAALPSYILLAVWSRIRIGRLSYTRAGIWFTAWAIPLFNWQIGPWAWISVVIPMMLAATRRELLQAAAMVWRRMRRL